MLNHYKGCPSAAAKGSGINHFNENRQKLLISSKSTPCTSPKTKASTRLHMNHN